MSKLKSYKYQKYEGIFYEIGSLDDSNHGMFWMEDDYVWGTLSEVTKNLSICEFF